MCLHAGGPVDPTMLLSDHTQFGDGVEHVEVLLKVVKDDLGGVCGELCGS